MAKRKTAKRKTAKRKTQALVRRPAMALDQPTAASGTLGVFERMARNPNLTVGELGELIKFHERQEEREATKAFDAAYREMLPNIPRIKRSGKILNKLKEVQSHYATYEAIRRVVDPIMRQYGFTFHPHTEWPANGVLEVVGCLEHVGGGKRYSRFRTTSDDSGGKNAIQGLGSGVSYGKRYTLVDLLAIVWEGQDDDGKMHGQAQREATARVLDVQPVRDRESNHVAGHDVERGEPITEKQLRRFHVIAGNSGRTELEIKTWLANRYGWTSSRQITRERYDEVWKALEAPGVLP